MCRARREMRRGRGNQKKMQLQQAPVYLLRMPELPEVEVASRQLRGWLEGRRIVICAGSGGVGKTRRPRTEFIRSQDHDARPPRRASASSPNTPC